MRKTNLLILGLASILIVSCGQGGKKEERDDPSTVKQTMALSKKDTIKVLELTNQFMTAVKEQRGHNTSLAKTRYRQTKK